nr:MAG TPA: hypothetical protein [Caudoviricetes sp.]
MAEFASNGKANAGLATGIIGTALSGLLTLGGGWLGNNSAYGYCNNATPRWVSQEEFSQQKTISSLESENARLKAEKNTDSKMVDVYERLDSKIRALENNVNDFKASQGVINAQVIANISVLQNQMAVLNGLTKTVIPITNVCPNPMPDKNAWVAPTTAAAA